MKRSIPLLFLILFFSAISTTTYAKGRVFTCDKYSGKTLERKAKRFNKTINRAARKHGVSSDFIKAVITVETCFRPRARGTSGEKGLMQLMPATARMYGVRDSFNVTQNIDGGTRYLKYLLKRYSGNKGYAAAAYNGGPGAVSRKSGPRFNQVRRYSRDVMRAYNKLRVTPSASGKYKSRKKSSKKRKKSKKNRKYIKKSRKRYSKKRSKKRAKKSRKTYRVKSNDTLYSISRKTGVSVKRLKRINRLKSNLIRKGQRLRVR
ncbi:MAG: Membrane-bound lytic murein transglycosylase D precursor (EC [uncultured Thiotrichaceae bacterium]|uniref:Membrane-bound lytic murein transglycosylase D (EC) n=1 Tax=uncultured Thiotrichaceae bacterium TaxID=298394 RepID=A0A6S6U3F8_9GAMM|nr:MAG: Membrane-bound lytic murein transglycosylase D precursor (EC [uncultured Thiotrichaceae bacterium]